MFQEVLGRSRFARTLITVFRSEPAPVPSSAERDDLLLLGSALRRVLSRCSADGARRHFSASVQVYRILRAQLSRRTAAQLCPYLLSDALHEIAGHVERPVRDAALRCLLRARAAK